MQAWFNEGSMPLPTVIASPPEKVVEGEGVLKLPAGLEAALLLESPDGDVLRLSWEQTKGSDQPTDRRRALPAGTYKLLSVRQIDRSRKGELWHTSSTGRQLGELDVEEGEELLLELDRTIVIKRGLRPKQVAMGITHPSGAGLSIYKDGRRIPIGYKLLGADDKILRKGPMNYG